MKDRIQEVKGRIARAAADSGRDPAEIRLVAVSKTVPAHRVREAVAAGADILGENYIQEARDKHEALADCAVSWHFIGHLQSNKAKYAVRFFDLIHSVDALKLAVELNKQAEKRKKVQDILIQVNIAGEATKSGASTPAVLDLMEAVSQLPNLAVKGLMTMPPFFDDPENARPYFRALRLLRETVAGEDIPNIAMDELSMGMTGDFETAIAEGATLVRIGTAIFGARR